MVFQSFPVYVDPPVWNQQEIRPPPAAPPPAEASVRVGSMTDRARQAKIPLPEAGLKCPRCESTNTKFCYFNNYSFSQPRHFCKTCRRYWTRGGALRNVPVGGGCRRNKRSKTGGGGGSSKSFASSADRHLSCSNGAISSDIPPNETLPFFPSLHPLPQYSGVSSAAIFDQWRIQQVHQFPPMEGLEAPPPPLSVGLFPFDGPGFYPEQTAEAEAEASIKGDEEDQELARRKYSLGIPKNEHFWGDDGGAAAGSGGVWADISGFSAASAGDTL